MLCVFGETERQRERWCREAGRRKEGERGREVEGRAVQREVERLRPLEKMGVLEPSQLSAWGWKAAPNTHTLVPASRCLWRHYYCMKLQHLKGLCSVSKLSYLRISCVPRGRFPNLPTFHKRTVTLLPPSDLPDEKCRGATKTELIYWWIKTHRPTHWALLPCLIQIPVSCEACSFRRTVV